MRKPIKGIVFAGCSFTWGQGLYYYGNLPTLRSQPKNTFDPALVSPAHIASMSSIRFPRIVANHFNTFEVLHTLNGGSHDSIIRWWECSFNPDPNDNSVDSNYCPKYDYSEISDVVFQLTQCHRCPNTTFPQIMAYNETLDPKYRTMMTNWLAENQMSINEYIDYYIKTSVSNVKKLLEKFESNGVRTHIVTWPKENVSTILADSWLSDRYLRLEYNNQLYDSMEDLMRNPEMKISTDYNSFEVPPDDEHPSKLCHQIMASNIIRHLENKK